jgi:hypothetical protein
MTGRVLSVSKIENFKLPGTKHIELDYCFILDKILSVDISAPFVKSGDELADVFTKSSCRGRL